MSLVCADCPAPITRKSRTGRCKSCAPKRRAADPVSRAHHRARSKEGAAKRLAKPGELERLRQVMLANRSSDPAVVAKAAATRDRKFMGWCPPAYRTLNRTLRLKGYSRAERMELIAEEVRRAERARLASLTRLERQLERVRNGATVVEVRPMPSREYAFTLGGVSA